MEILISTIKVCDKINWNDDEMGPIYNKELL